jgi:hypothetical protein
MYSDLIKTGLIGFDKVRDVLRGAKANSLIDYTAAARVEPIVLIDNDVMHYESIGEVQQSLLAMFSGYYLQAAALSNTLGDVKVLRRLEALNPARNAGDSVLNGNSWLLAKEAYAYKLPFPEDVKLKVSVESYGESNTETTIVDPRLQSAMEAMSPSQAKRQAAINTQATPAPAATPAASGTPSAANQMVDKVGSYMPKQAIGNIAFGGDVNRTLNELANLSVGKMYEVQVAEGDNKASLQVSIRLIASAMRTEDLVHILSTGSADESWKERWHGWRSERLSFWKDLVLCQDIIAQHRRDLINDPSGVRSKLNKVQRSNQLATLVTGRPTIASSSNMIVISANTRDKLELKLEGKLSNFKIREKMFEKTYIMIMAVIDEDYQRVTFYHRGISMPTDVRLRDLSTSNKGSGPSVTEILKAYQMSSAPSL